MSTRGGENEPGVVPKPQEPPKRIFSIKEITDIMTDLNSRESKYDRLSERDLRIATKLVDKFLFVGFNDIAEGETNDARTVRV